MAKGRQLTEAEVEALEWVCTPEGRMLMEYHHPQTMARLRAAIAKMLHTVQTADEQTPNDGHTFRITFDSRGSSKVRGEREYTDAPAYSGYERTIEVRAWNLRDALMKAAVMPLDRWFQEESSG